MPQIAQSPRPPLWNLHLPLPPPRVRGLDDDPAPGEEAPACKAPDPAMEPFARREHTQRDALAERLHGDLQVRGLMDRWATLTVNDRLALARRVSELMGDLYGFTPAPMRLVTDKQAGGADGQYDDAPKPIGRIDLNAKMMQGASKSVMVDFLDTVVHEQTHRYQDHLVKLLKAGKIARDDVRHGFAKALAANDAQYHEASDDPRKDLKYRCQISERHAWNNGTGVITRLMKLRTTRFAAVG